MVILILKLKMKSEINKKSQYQYGNSYSKGSKIERIRLFKCLNTNMVILIQLKISDLDNLGLKSQYQYGNSYSGTNHPWMPSKWLVSIPIW